MLRYQGKSSNWKAQRHESYKKQCMERKLERSREIPVPKPTEARGTRGGYVTPGSHSAANSARTMQFQATRLQVSHPPTTTPISTVPAAPASTARTPSRCTPPLFCLRTEVLTFRFPGLFPTCESAFTRGRRSPVPGIDTDLTSPNLAPSTKPPSRSYSRSCSCLPRNHRNGPTCHPPQAPAVQHDVEPPTHRQDPWRRPPLPPHQKARDRAQVRRLRQQAQRGASCLASSRSTSHPFLIVLCI